MADLQDNFENFVLLVDKLRSEKGCPWDREQTPLSLKRYLIEETDELLEAIDSPDHQHVMEELGDLLYLIILLARIYDEDNLFNINRVIKSITGKMLRRHPHVFGNEKIASTAELKEVWRQIKISEKAERKNRKKN